jgi:hypothetical protein
MVKRVYVFVVCLIIKVILSNILLTANASIISEPKNLFGNLVLATFEQGDLAQSFKQTANNIVGARIKLQQNLETTDSITISLYNALPNAGGNLIISGTTNTSAAIEYSFNYVAEVLWAPTAIEPNTTYFLVFTSNNPNLVIMGSGYVYNQGDAYANKGFIPCSDYDYAFQTLSNSEFDKPLKTNDGNTYDDDTLLQFYWTAATGNVHHYNIYLSTNEANYTLLGTTHTAPTQTTPYSVPIKAEDGKKYRLKVEAVDAIGSPGVGSDPSDIVFCKLRSPGDINGKTIGDVDGNLKVGASDFTIISNSWGKQRGVDATFDYRADLDYNSIVDVSDFNILVNNWGKIYNGAASRATQQIPVVSSSSNCKIRLIGTQNLRVGEEATIDIAVEMADDLYSLSFEIAYDSTNIKVRGIQQGTLFSATEQSVESNLVKNLSNSSWIAGRINQSPGLISPTLAAVPLGSSIGKNGDGVIARLKVIPKAGGSYTISLKNVCAYNSKLDAISLTPFDSVLQIESPKNILEQNYPNPFNPETWIPYQLNESTNVTVKIYESSGKLVKTLDLGNKPKGFYTSKDKAAYWDGKNETGELVSSGIYFYSIQAGSYTATKKMIIQK